MATAASRGWSRVGKVLLGAVAVVVVLAAVAIFTVSNTDWGRHQLRTRVVAVLDEAANGTVRIGRISGNLLSGLTLHDVAITDSAGAPFFAARLVRASYGLRALIGKRIALSDVRLIEPVVVLNRYADGRWNYERIFPSDTTQPSGTSGGFADWIVLEDVYLADGTLVVRTPWRPDTTLRGVQRDSAVASALAGTGITVVVRTGGGAGALQQVQEFREITARLPLVRVAHPDFPARLIRADSLRMQAFAFAPPAAAVRQLSGSFELDGDSLWFSQIALQLPDSRAQLSGKYDFASGDLVMSMAARPVALRDVRFLYPPLPDSGTARFDLALDWTGTSQRYVVRDLDLRISGGHVQGDLGLSLGDTLFLHDTSLEFDQLSTGLIEQLVAGLDLPRQGLLSGQIVAEGPLAAMQINGDVTFDDERSGRSRLLAVGEVGTSDGVFRARDLRVRVSPMQMDLARIAVPAWPLGGVVNGSTTLNGRTDQTLRASGLTLTHTDGAERSVLAGSGAIQTANASGGTPTVLEARLTARPLSLLSVGRFAPAAGLRGNVSGPITVIGPLSDLLVNSTLRTSDGGTLSAQGRLDVASPEIGYALDIATQLFNANELVASAPVTSVSADIEARGRGFDPETMRGEYAAFLVTSSVDTFALDSSLIRLHVGGGLATLDTLSVRAPGAAVDATGTFGLGRQAQGRLSYRAQVDSLSKLARYFPRDTGMVVPRPLTTAERLARARADSARIGRQRAVARAAGVELPAQPLQIDTVPPIRKDALAGSLLARGEIVGGLSGFDLRGTLAADNLLALGNSLARARAEYTWTRALTDSGRIAVNLSADSLLAAGFALDSVNAKLSYLAPGGTAQVAVFQTSSRDYAVGADYAIYPDRRELRFNDLRLRFDTTRWVATNAGAIRWGQPGIEVDSVDLRNSSGGRVFADGRVPSQGLADLRLIVRNFQVADLMGLLQSDLEASGLISLNTRIEGSSRAPRIEGQLGIAEATYGGVVVPELQSSFRYADQRLTTDAQLRDPRLSNGAGRTLAEATARLPLNLAFSDVTGSRVLDAPASGALRADSLPLDLLSRFTDVVANMRGSAAGQATLAGPLRDPTVVGTLAIADARTDVVPLGVSMERINGYVRFTGDSVIVDSLTAFSRGRISLAGGVAIRDLAAPSFDLRLRADNARVLNNDQGRASANADITIVGPYTNLQVDGQVRIREGVFYIPKPDNRQVINAGDPAVFAVIDTASAVARELLPDRSALLDNLRMNIGLDVDRDTWVRSQEANIEIYSDGTLRISVDRRRQALSLDGVVNTDRGEYEFLSKRFRVKQGVVRFIGTQELNPLLQITGEYQVQQAAQQSLNIRIVIGGTLMSPRLTLESDAQPPISQSDLLSYLAFGNESGSLLQFGGSSLSGGTAGGGLVGTSAALATRQLTGVALGVAVNELEGQAARSLGADVLNITPASLPPELASGNFGALTTFFKGTQLEFGKYLNTSTFVGLQLQPTTIPGFRVEHRFGRTRGLSLESTFQPRFFLPEPSLSEQEITKANAFGMFLVRHWRF